MESALWWLGGRGIVTVVELPGDHGTRLDWARFDALSATAYLFTDGSAWWRLECTSPEPPEDRWLSIAETFEFLPAEE